MPASTSASGMLGVSTVASGTSRALRVATASGASKACPPLATITGSATSGIPPGSMSHTASIVATSCSMPVLIASAPMSLSTTSICWRRKAVDTASMPCTPKVFCAVSAVMAVAAKAPIAVTDLMSA